MKKIVSLLMSFILTAALFPYNVDAAEHIEESRYSAEEYIGMTEESESAYGEEPKYDVDDAHNLGSAAMERPSALADIFASDKDWAKVSRFFHFLSCSFRE